MFFKLNTSIILDEAVILTEVFTYSVDTVAARNIYGIGRSDICIKLWSIVDPTDAQHFTATLAFGNLRVRHAIPNANKLSADIHHTGSNQTLDL